MRSSETVTLPEAELGYDHHNEQTMRRTVEQGFQDLRADVVDNQNKTSKNASLSLRRFQFLLMGG